MNVKIKQNMIRKEKMPLSTKFVHFLIKIGIIPIFISKDGDLTFFFFSWKTVANVIFSLTIWILFIFLCSLINPPNNQSNYLSSSDVILGFALLINYLFSVFGIIYPILLSYGISKINNGIFFLQHFGWPKKNFKERT